MCLSISGVSIQNFYLTNTGKKCFAYMVSLISPDLFFTQLQVIQINFEEFDLEIAYDTLTIGDGGEVGDPTTILQV